MKISKISVKNVRRLAVKLSKVGEKYVLSGHPWVFSDSIVKVNANAKTGDITIIFSQKTNKVIGVGLYDASSPIRIKLLHSGSPTAIDSGFFRLKIEEAYQKREELLMTDTNSYRFIFGENDNFPGLIADVYDYVLVVKLYSEIWLPYFEDILSNLLECSNCSAVVLRLSRNLENSKQLNFCDGTVIYGELINEVVPFKEHGIHFSANVIKGHKTGYFLDHRHNRKRVGELSGGKSVLDVFSYAGGFSVHALANDAKEVISLDVSSHALEQAQYNAHLNTFSGTHKIIIGDAFTEMKRLIQQKVLFDIVVIDPPSFAKQQSEIDLAKKKYAQLAELGVQLVNDNGILVLASCSSRISAQTFFDINRQVLSRQSRPFKVVDKTFHDSDHPISFTEGAYLKCGYYKF